MSKSTSKLFSEENDNKPEKALNEAVEKEISEEEKNRPIVSENTAEVEQPGDDGIVDLDFSAIRKKRFRINGDNNKILELNTSDMRIATRLTVAYDNLNKLMDDVGSVLQSLPDDPEKIDNDTFKTYADQLNKLDEKMKEQLDYLFDAPIGKVFSDDGSMWDLFDGSFRYEHIIERLLPHYENNLNREFSKMKQRVAGRTQKYTKAAKYHR